MSQHGKSPFNNPPASEPLPVGYPRTFAAMEKAFREKIKTFRCPYCDIEFSDFAVDWGNGYQEGRLETRRQLGAESERDGPFKLKCELCGRRSWYHLFISTVVGAEDTHELP